MAFANDRIAFPVAGSKDTRCRVSNRDRWRSADREKFSREIEIPVKRSGTGISSIAEATVITKAKAKLGQRRPVASEVQCVA